MFYLFAFMAGICITLQLIFNANLSQKIGTINTTLINFIIASVILGIIALMNPSLMKGLSNIQAVPFYLYLGGFLGIIVMLLSNYLIPKISILYTTILIFFGQLFSGIFLDLFLGYQFSIKKIIGMLLIFSGIIYLIIYDYYEKNKKIQTV